MCIRDRYSGTVSGFTSPADGLQQQIPGAFTASNIADTSFDVNWGASTSPVAAEYYEVDIATNSAFTDATTHNVPSGTSFTFTGLIPDTDYYARVRAYSTTGGYSIYNFIGTNVAVRTLELLPQTPTGIVAQNSTLSTFEIAHDDLSLINI